MICKLRSTYFVIFLGQPPPPPPSVDTSMHYSWDYAQHCQQVGPIYIKTLRKCNLFGMSSEGSGMNNKYGPLP